MGHEWPRGIMATWSRQRLILRMVLESPLGAPARGIKASAAPEAPVNCLKRPLNRPGITVCPLCLCSAGSHVLPGHAPSASRYTHLLATSPDATTCSVSVIGG